MYDGRFGDLGDFLQSIISFSHNGFDDGLSYIVFVVKAAEIIFRLCGIFLIFAAAFGAAILGSWLVLQVELN
jgi:hypothetical protein